MPSDISHDPIRRDINQPLRRVSVIRSNVSRLPCLPYSHFPLDRPKPKHGHVSIAPGRIRVHSLKKRTDCQFLVIHWDKKNKLTDWEVPEVAIRSRLVRRYPAAHRSAQTGADANMANWPPLVGFREAAVAEPKSVACREILSQIPPGQRMSHGKTWLRRVRMKPVPDRVEGLHLDLRLVTPEDAGYIHSLRINPTYNAYMRPSLKGDVEDQRAWIETYKKREADGLEFYFIIVRKDGVRCGTSRLSNIEKEQFTWGSLILDESKPRKAALESAVLSHIVGFEILEKKRVAGYVRHDNTHMQRFLERFGWVRIGDDEDFIYYEFKNESFLNQKNHFMQVLAESN